MKVFDKYWFQKHQPKLLWLANSWIGKYIFQFRKMGHYLENRIVKITPYSVGEFLSIKDDKVEIREHFFGSNVYAQKLYLYLLPLWFAMHIWDWFVVDHFHLAPKLNFGFLTLTQNPGTIGLDNPCDGRLAAAGKDETLTVLRGDAGTASSNANIIINVGASATSNQFERIFRSATCFDTSSLTSSASISSVVLSGWGFTKANPLGSPVLNITSITVGSTSGLVNSDFNIANFGSTSFGSVSYASFDATDTIYTDITLNASGISNISLTGISQFGWRTDWDLNNSFTGVWVSSVISQFGIRSVANGSNFPKLVVTYTISATKLNVNLLSLLGVG